MFREILLIVLELLHFKLDTLQIALFSRASKFDNVLIRVAETFPSFLCVVPIVAEAQQAELVSALLASHVHAALVLLDAYLAVWTGLSI
jgi:hypothetical protein